MIVCFSVLGKIILNPEYYVVMFDCVFVGSYLSHFGLIYRLQIEQVNSDCNDSDDDFIQLNGSMHVTTEQLQL